MWAAACHDPLPVGGIAVSVIIGTHALLGFPVSVPLLVAAFCGATLVYGADRVLATAPEDEWNRPDRVAWIESHRRWLVGEGVIVAAVGGAALLFLRPVTVLGAALLGAIALAHQWGAGTDGPWTAGIAKPLMIALVWAVGSTALPMLEAGGLRLEPLVWLVGYRTLFILPNVLLSDWGDRRGDRAAGLQPWGDGVPVSVVRWGASGVLLAALVLLAGGRGFGLPWALLAVEAGGPVLMLAALWRLRPERSAHRLALDVIVAWPVVTAAVAWLVV